MVLTLYKLDASPPVRAVLMVIEELGIRDIEYIDVNLLNGSHLKDEYLKLNPQHTVPLLKDGDFVVWDSHAITTYLIGKYSDNDTLYPKDLQKRALIDQRLHFDTGILFPSCRNTLEPVLFRGEKAFRPEDLEKITASYQFTENFLTSPWLVGDELTLADICCVSSISSLNVIIPIDANKYPKLTDWFKRISEKDFYKKINQPGVEQLAELIKSKLN